MIRVTIIRSDLPGMHSFLHEQANPFSGRYIWLKCRVVVVSFESTGSFCVCTTQAEINARAARSRGAHTNSVTDHRFIDLWLNWWFICRATVSSNPLILHLVHAIGNTPRTGNCYSRESIFGGAFHSLQQHLPWTTFWGAGQIDNWNIDSSTHIHVRRFRARSQVFPLYSAN